MFNLKKGFLRIFMLGVIVLSPLSGALTVSAQQVSLSITPPIIDAAMKPGKSIMIAYNLKNGGDPAILNTRIVDFEPRDNMGSVRLKDDATGPVRFSLDNANLQLGEPFFLKTGETQQLLLRIRVPDNAPNGDYYYSLLAQTEPPTTTEGVVSSRARATIASNILITVTDSGIIDIKPKITIFDTLSNIKLSLFGKDIRIFDSLDRIPVVLYMENKGVNRIVPNGKISLRGAYGQTANFDILPKNILASSQRLLEATPSADLNASSYKNSPPTLVLSGLYIGRYSISANVNFGENSPNLFASTSFFAFPFKISLAVIALIAITVYLTKRFGNNDDQDR